MKYYIKERHNPQLGVRHTAVGKITVAQAKKMENTIYGTNYLTGYSKSEYLAECQRLNIEPVL